MPISLCDSYLGLGGASIRPSCVSRGGCWMWGVFVKRFSESTLLMVFVVFLEALVVPLPLISFGLNLALMCPLIGPYFVLFATPNKGTLSLMFEFYPFWGQTLFFGGSQILSFWSQKF